MNDSLPVANSIPEYIGDILAGVWPDATRLESNQRNYAKLFEEADADDAKTVFLVQFIAFMQKEPLKTDSGARLARPKGDPNDRQMFAITVRFPPADEAIDLRADGYTRMYDAVRALRAGYLFMIDGEKYSLDIVGGQAVEPPTDDDITVDVFEIAVTAE